MASSARSPALQAQGWSYLAGPSAWATAFLPFTAQLGHPLLGLPRPPDKTSPL